MPRQRLALIPLGTEIGYWTVLAGPSANRHAGVPRVEYLCRCRCSTERYVRAELLVKQLSKSCGCFDRHRDGRTREKHGWTGTPEYQAWYGMRARCEKPTHAAFKYYGGRGISVCEAWRESFEAFLRDVGPRPSAKYSIDRIDNDGNYEPSNVRWATHEEQMRNRRNVRRFAHDGMALTLEEWSARVGINADCLRQRIIDMRWPVERALTEGLHH